MYEKATSIAADDRDALEEELAVLGYVVQHLIGLEAMYLDAPLDVRDVLHAGP